MVEIVINGIIESLKTEFPDHKVYTSTVRQGLTEPCFVVVPLKSYVSRKFGDRCIHTYTFAIHYFPKNRDDVETCFDAQERLSDCLKMIKIQAVKAHCFDLNSHIDDGVLTLECSYNVHSLPIKSAYDVMENIEIN